MSSTSAGMKRARLERVIDHLVFSGGMGKSVARSLILSTPTPCVLEGA
ncbi:hypothetical protein ACMDCT_07620 [Halomonadaceae bacterium KBTZ08]